MSNITIIHLSHYRSLGMLKEAEIIEQQMLRHRRPDQQSSSGAGGTQPDYSAQWADYYR